MSHATTCTFRYSVQKVLEEAEERDVRQLKIRKSGMGISDIIVEECDKFQVSATALRNGSRRSKMSKAMAVIARRSAEELGLTAAEIARHLGVSTSAITKAIARA